MQANTRTGRPVKNRSLQLITLSLTRCPRMGLPRSLPLISPRAKPPAKPPRTHLPPSKLATSEPPIDKSYIDSPNTVEAPKPPSAAGLPMSATHIQGMAQCWRSGLLCRVWHVLLFTSFLDLGNWEIFCGVADGVEIDEY